jgi:hypothetical protein
MAEPFGKDRRKTAAAMAVNIFFMWRSFVGS